MGPSKFENPWDFLTANGDQTYLYYWDFLLSFKRQYIFNRDCAWNHNLTFENLLKFNSPGVCSYRASRAMNLGYKFIFEYEKVL